MDLRSKDMDVAWDIETDPDPAADDDADADADADQYGCTPNEKQKWRIRNTSPNGNGKGIRRTKGSAKLARPAPNWRKLSSNATQCWPSLFFS